jgi:hypothetical protein
MNKAISILAVFIFSTATIIGQFNPSDAEKSLVKVMVLKEGKSASVLSGFVWKKGEWIVTSLHGMKPGYDITVQYLNKHWRSAKIIKVYKEADLVLLEVDKTKVPAGVVAIQDYADKKLNFGEDIIAIGYNSNSKSSSTRKMSKGHVNPENLESLVPETDRQRLAQAGIPSIDIDIIYLDGSLLPGYSGSPAYDKDGNLVGIGDGGLEGGSSNVSWIIPAKFLANLENSSVTSLPPDFEKLTMHFSAETKVDLSQKPISTGGGEVNPEAVEDIFAEEFVSYNYGGFEFYYTKTRTFEEMYQTTYDPENISMFVQEFQDMNLNVDYSVLAFDIYEDATNGIVLAVPEGQELTYDEMNDVFMVDLTDFPQSPYFAMLFEGSKEPADINNKDETIATLLENINIALGTNVGGFTLDEDYSYGTDVDEERSIYWLLLQGNQYVLNDDGTNGAIFLYITLLLDKEKAFYSLAVLNTPVEVLEYASTTGINCVDYYDNTPEFCDYFESYIQLMSAVHLTTYANKKVVSNR